jgi:hypothetical protein
MRCTGITTYKHANTISGELQELLQEFCRIDARTRSFSAHRGQPTCQVVRIPSSCHDESKSSNDRKRPLSTYQLLATCRRCNLPILDFPAYPEAHIARTIGCLARRRGTLREQQCLSTLSVSKVHFRIAISSIIQILSTLF